jgi:DNA-binding transcriptional MerR regulator
MTDEAGLTLTESARRLGIPPETLRRWVAEGLVRSVAGPHGRPRFRPDEIERTRAALGFPAQPAAGASFLDRRPPR